MKFVKKLTALFLAVCMVMAMGITAFAADQTYTITAPNNGHTYEVFQIFTGDLKDSVLSNIKWGKNGTGTTGEKVNDDTLTAINNIKGTDQEKANALDDYADLTSEPVATLTGSEKAIVAAGYYLIRDKVTDQGSTVPEGEAATTYLVKICKDLTISPKSSVPSFEKKIKDINDTTDTGYTGWQDSADYDLGDEIPFKLEGTVADNYASYSKYTFIFHDVEEKGLAFQSNTVKVYVDDTEITQGYQIVTSGLNDGCTFEIKFDDLKTLTEATVKAGSKIRVEYKSKLTSDAVVGSQGNVNKARLEFSNNPNSGQEGSTEKTPWDNVIVFTYKVVINKVDSNQKALGGAAFKLEKKLKDGTTKVVGLVNATEDGEGGYTATDADKTDFSWSHLDDGDYVLTEIVTPDGYNTVSPITFTVNAEHKITWTTEQRTDVLTSFSGTSTSGDITITASQKDEGEIDANVINKKGAELPETGGMGTTVLYVAGIAMIVAAGVVVIARKRMA